MPIRSQFPQQSSPLGTIAFVGEAPGAAEVSKAYPFAGASGWLLGEACRAVGIERRACYLSNVLADPYPGQEFKSACGGAEAKGSEAPFCFPVSAGAYLLEDWWPHVRRLWTELSQVKPALTIALGGPATWALVPGGPPQVQRSAGTVRPGYLGPVLTTYNPAAILRGTGARQKPAFYAHLALAVEHLREGSIQSRVSEERIWLQPTLADLERFDRHLARLPSGSPLSVDIETANGMVECVGYGAGNLTLVVPWHVDEPGTGNFHPYWPLPEEFLTAWSWQRRWLEAQGADPAPTDWINASLDGLNATMERLYGLGVGASGLEHRIGDPVRNAGGGDLPALTKVMHNGIYDSQWLLVRGSIAVSGYAFDTRLQHYTLDMEAPKDLGGLGTRYFGVNWKGMASKAVEGKRDA